jgi:hypothetical protein
VEYGFGRHEFVIAKPLRAIETRQDVFVRRMSSTQARASRMESFFFNGALKV